MYICFKGNRELYGNKYKMSCYDRTHFFKKDDTFLNESQIDLTCDVKYV